MTLQGKGFFIWSITRCEGGDVNAIANLAQQAQFTHLEIKIADGTSSYNINPTTGADRVPPLVEALHARGIQAWGWHYIYGDDPIGEADKAIQRVSELGLDGYAIDAEIQYNQRGMESAADAYMERLRTGLPNTPLALCSYRFPTVQPYFPFKNFLNRCDLNMPQMYWLKAHNPGDQLIRCVREFTALTPFRPIIPVGAAFKEGSWAASASEVTEFLQTARNLNLSAATFWEWGNTRLYDPEAWPAAVNFPWDGSVTPAPGATLTATATPSATATPLATATARATATPLTTATARATAIVTATLALQDIVQQYINALNTHDPNKVLELYTPAAVHVTPQRTIQGTAEIKDWYKTLLNQTLPNSSFVLVNSSGTDSARRFDWTATSSNGAIHDGNDTFGILNGKIVYHYTSFHITSV